MNYSQLGPPENDTIAVTKVLIYLLNPRDICQQIYTDKSFVQFLKTEQQEENDIISEMKVHMSELNMKVCKFDKVERDILF